MQGIVHDITAQKEAEEARLNAERPEAQNRQIQAESRLKSQFLANMSHELRTPLNAVIGFADLLHMGAVPPDSLQHHEFLGHIGNSGRHLLQLINDVLDLSKVESGKFEFVAESLQLPTLLTQVCDVLQTAIQRKRLSVTQEIDPGLGALQLDVARLKQVLYNYLSNAIKFTPDGGAVILRALAQGPDHFRVEVQDSGIGIATNDLPRLFVEFQQLDAGYSEQHQGTGLGLALTRRLIEAQGGQVGVSSEPGVGSVFHFVLNRIHGHDLASAAAPPDRLLLIEADARAPEQLVLGLARAGFAAEPAATGEQAVRRAAQTA
jgi:signal transduction histidine kinase